jgi:signal transduction histidine kinase
MVERIFEYLYQVTESSHAGRKGLGLGLHIARDLVARQGGSIWATSAQGSGSVFPLRSLPSLNWGHEESVPIEVSRSAS